MEQQKTDKKGFVEEREKVITEVELIENKFDSQQVDKIIFASSDGNITWKPKLTKSSFEGGFKVTKTVPMEKDLIPEIVQKIAQEANEKGSVKVSAAYNFWITEKDGAEVTYRFLNSAVTLNRWKIIPSILKEEKVDETP